MPDAVVRTARETQLSASELLVRSSLLYRARHAAKASPRTQAEFLQAADLKEAVSKRVSLLDEAWFTAVSTYISLARREGQPQVEESLTAVLRAAAAAKDATLRPEIRLLNALMRVTTAAERELLFFQQAQALVRCADAPPACASGLFSRACPRSDNGYFFTLLARVTSDVERQPGGALNPKRQETLALLGTIATEAQRYKPAQG